MTRKQNIKMSKFVFEEVTNIIPGDVEPGCCGTEQQYVNVILSVQKIITIIMRVYAAIVTDGIKREKELGRVKRLR